MITRFRWTESKIEILRTRYPSERAGSIPALGTTRIQAALGDVSRFSFMSV